MGARREDHAGRFLERLAALDADGAAAIVSPDYEGIAAADPLGGSRRVYRGRDGLRSWIAEAGASRGAFRVERLRFRDYGDALLVVGENHAVGQRNPFGAPEHRRVFVAVFRFDGDQIASVHTYPTYEDAISTEGFAESEQGERPT